MTYARALWYELKGRDVPYDSKDKKSKIFLNSSMYLLQNTVGYFNYPFEVTVQGMLSYEITEEMRERENGKSVTFCNDIMSVITNLKHLIMCRPQTMEEWEWLECCAFVYRYWKFVCAYNATMYSIVQEVQGHKLGKTFSAETIIKAINDMFQSGF